MEQLDALPNPAQYKALHGQTALLNGKVVTVYVYEKHSQSGSYARGFKYTDSTYGLLKYGALFSADHGATWHHFPEDAKKQRAGKVLIERRHNKEFAFEDIQKINRSYDPSYKWSA